MTTHIYTKRLIRPQQYLVGIILMLILLVGLSMPTSGQQLFQVPSQEDHTLITEQIKKLQRFHPSIMPVRKTTVDHSVMIPKSEIKHSSPLFCRLEDRINQDNVIQCRFRLGSLSYVNYLEQKGEHKRLLLEQIRRM